MNNITIDLKKVQYAHLYYKNQFGQAYPTLPKRPSVNGMYVSDKEIAAYHALYPGETMRERAARLDLFDRWIPVVVFQFAANHSVQYEGKKAKSMWKSWQSHIFGKKK